MTLKRPPDTRLESQVENQLVELAQQPPGQRNRRRLTEEELNTFAAVAPVMLKRYDLTGRCIYISPGSERFTAKPSGWFIGRHIEDYHGYPLTFIDAIRNSLATIIRTGEPQVFETSLEKPWGVAHRVHHHCPEFDEDGTIVSVLSILVDVTAKHNSQQILERNLQEQSHFLALMAHELRNPLAAVLSGLQALDRRPQEESAQEIRAVMHREISHITRLISDLLDTSRLDTGTLRYQITEHHLSESIDLAIDLCQHCFANAGQQLHTKLEASDVVIRGDTSRIAQAVSNLLHNASKFSPPGCAITLATRSNKDLVEIDIIDHGGGIPPLEQAQLFKRYRPGSGGKNILSHYCNSGLGLGLYLSREIIRCHGGDIALVSSSSAGSLFRISLPIHQLRPYGQLPASTMEAVQTSSVPVSILAVDDNAAALELLRLLLELEGHTVNTASNARDAERLFAQMRPDVVLLDIGLPDLNGRDLAKKLRNHEHGRKSLIIALTGWGTEQDELLSREAGCDAHITKPANIDQLCSLFTPRKTEAA